MKRAMADDCTKARVVLGDPRHAVDRFRRGAV
jgi:hypothetical protein